MNEGERSIDDAVAEIQEAVDRDTRFRYSLKVIYEANNPSNVGRMNSPDAAAIITGPCGDTMEFYLLISNGIIEDIQFFKPVTNLLYKARNGRMLKDNPERYAYFARVALENPKHLFWKPDIIICNDWQMSFIPALYSLQYADQDFYQDIKTIFLLHSVNENAYFSRLSYDAVDLFASDDDRLPKPEDNLNNLNLAIDFADQVVVVHAPDSGIDEDLKTNPDVAERLASKKGVEHLNIGEDTDAAWLQAAGQFEKLLRNL